MEIHGECLAGQSANNYWSALQPLWIQGQTTIRLHPKQLLNRVRTTIGHCPDLYWSASWPILVRRRSYIGRDDDLYRMTKRAI